MNCWADDGIDESTIADAVFRLVGKNAVTNAAHCRCSRCTPSWKECCCSNAFESLLTQWQAAGAAMTRMATIHELAAAATAAGSDRHHGRGAGALGVARHSAPERGGGVNLSARAEQSRALAVLGACGAFESGVAGDLGEPAALQSRRRALCGDSARDAQRRRLGHPALERPGLHRKAAAAVLGDGGDLSIARRERVLGAPVHRADRARDRGSGRISGGAALGQRRRLARRGGSLRHVHVRGLGSAHDLGHEPDVLDDGEPCGIFAGAAAQTRRSAAGCCWPGLPPPWGC